MRTAQSRSQARSSAQPRLRSSAHSNASARRRRSVVVALNVLTLAPIAAAFALPTGEQVVAGQVGVARPNAQSMVVRQGSPKAIVNWQGFSIGAGEAVTFQQPGAASVILNRVIGNDASTIYGHLNANGQVFLVNPSGVLFGPSARVDVGGLVASTLNIGNDDFLAGRYRFAGRGAPGKVDNQGVLNARDGGFVALLGGQVNNDGTITARLGTTALAAGNRMTLDFAGDGLLRIAIDEAALAALVRNQGAVIADGGQAILTARSAEALAQAVVNQSGIVRARTLTERAGLIVLDGGSTGQTLANGTLDATGVESGRKGGDIHVLGHHVGVTDRAMLDASGAAGGGNVLVGGDYQGANAAIRNAAATYFGPEATLRADAIEQDNGGKIIVWGNDTMRAHGTASAQGGAQGGDGGLVETSGKWIDVTGLRVNASAPRGSAGNWLLDPEDLLVVNGAGTTPGLIASGGPPPNAFVSSSQPASMGADLINDALNTSTNVTLTTGATSLDDGSIDFNANVTKSQGGDATLTLRAHNAILINGNSSFVSTAPGGRLNVVLNADSDGNGSGSMVIGSNFLCAACTGPVTFSTNGGSLLISGGVDPQTGRVGTGSIDFSSGNVNFLLSVDTSAWLTNVSIDTGGGDFVLRAGSATGVAGNTGVRITASTIDTGAGALTIDGIGSNGQSQAGAGVAGGAAGQGVDLESNSFLRSTSGAIAITGAGGTGGAGGAGAAGGNGGVGTSLVDTSVSSTSGTVSVRGTGGSGGAGTPFGGSDATGLLVRAGPPGNAAVATQSGAIDLFGRVPASAAGSGGGNGAFIASTLIAATAGGSITISGRGEAGITAAIPRGVVFDDALVTTSGAGTILVSGESTGATQGVVVGGVTRLGGPAATGSIIVRATNGGGADSIDLGSSASGGLVTTGAVNLRPGGVAANGQLTAAAADFIDINGATNVFSLDNAELTRISPSAAALVIGGSTHDGRIRLGAPTTFANPLTLQNGGSDSAGIRLDFALANAGRAVTLSSGGPVTQAAPIAAASLLLHGTDAGSSFTLTNPANAVAQFDADSPLGGQVSFENGTALTIGPLAGIGFDAATNTATTIATPNTVSFGDLFVRAAGNLGLAHNIGTVGSDIDLVTSGVFDNFGGGAITPGGGGRWRVWADTWVGETRGGLVGTSPFPNFYGCTYPGACTSGVTLPATGNRFIYVQRPAVTVIADDKQRLTTQPNPPLTFSTVGLVNDDTPADAVSVTLATTAVFDSPVGTYPISVTAASSPVGYFVTTRNGLLSVIASPPSSATDSARIISEDSLLYDRNYGTTNLCTPAGPLAVPGSATALVDNLAREWTRVRERPNLSNCLGLSERNDCDDF